ncbi:MAG: sporulation protein YunB [Thermoanaerobacteraceae bacterium]|nr:sporulation protein YunB [Thermoanaerobacteraceae bacterium]
MRRRIRFKIHKAFRHRLSSGQMRVNRFFIYFLLIIILISLIFLFIEERIRPTVVTIGQAKARAIATEIINNAVKDALGYDGYKDLFYVSTDNNKRVAMVEPNTVKINNLVASTVDLVQKRLNELDTTDSYIYFGSIFNSQLFANVGPKINLKLYPVGSVSVDYRTTFDKAGINQTRYMLELIVNVKMQIVAPFISNSVDVSNNVPIAEMIIVGDVPQSYIDVNDENAPTALPYPSPIMPMK